MEKVAVTIAIELRAEVEKMIKDDPKMVGIARYLASVEIFWSFNIPTACAGDGFIFFNPDFYNQLPEPTRNTIMAHEVWHMILKHLDRGMPFDPADYNKAGDHVINNVLEEEGFSFDFGDMDFEPYLDHKYKSMSTEEVYNDIREEKKNNPPPPPGKSEDKDEDGNIPAAGTSQPKHVPRSVIEDLIKAASDAVAENDNYNNVPKQQEKNEKALEDLNIPMGSNTGYSHIKLEATNRKIAIKDSTYEKIFVKYLIDPISGAKRSFMRPNRRMHGIENPVFTLPGRVKRKHKSNRLAHLIYAMDVSGSITSEIRQQFHDSVRTIKELLNPNLLTVLFWDTEIKLIKTFKDNQPYGKISIEAGGCTNLDAVFAYAANRKTQAMVIFTDLAVTIPPEPKWHTIWLVPEKHRQSNVNNLYGDVYIIPKQ